LDTLFAESDIISLHCPLTPQTFHLIDAESIAKMKKGVMIINTSRGALVDAGAVIEGLKSEQIGYLGHQAYFTDRALENISNTTIANLTAFERGDTLVNEVTLAMLH
jgi:D-lactate dehydrogenase